MKTIKIAAVATGIVAAAWISGYLTAAYVTRQTLASRTKPAHLAARRTCQTLASRTKPAHLATRRTCDTSDVEDGQVQADEQECLQAPRVGRQPHATRNAATNDACPLTSPPGIAAHSGVQCVQVHADAQAGAQEYREASPAPLIGRQAQATPSSAVPNSVCLLTGLSGIVTHTGMSRAAISCRFVKTVCADGVAAVALTPGLPFVVQPNSKLYIAGRLVLQCDVSVGCGAELAFGQLFNGADRQAGHHVCARDLWTHARAAHANAAGDVGAVYGCGGTVMAGWTPDIQETRATWTGDLFLVAETCNAVCGNNGKSVHSASVDDAHPTLADAVCDVDNNCCDPGDETDFSEEFDPRFCEDTAHMTSRTGEDTEEEDNEEDNEDANVERNVIAAHKTVGGA